MKRFTRRGALVEDMRQTYLVEPDVDGDETQVQRDYLLAKGSDAQQDMLKCAPLPAPDFEAWLQQRAAGASWRAAA